MLRAARAAGRWLRDHPRLGGLALRVVPDIPLRIGLKHLGPFRIRLRRNRAFWLRDPEAFEHLPFRVLQCLVREGDVVADLGGNLGLYARFLAAWTRAGRVVSFEPWPENLALLRENVRIGDVEGLVEAFPFALADVDGHLDFQVDDVQSASGSLDRVRRGEPSEGRANLGLAPKLSKVESRTIDGLLEEGRFPPPDVLKVDVEGAEELVLRGALALLASRRPRLLIELHGAAEAREVLRLLFDLGYSAVGWAGADPAHVVLRELRPSDLAALQGRYDLNFVAASVDGGLPTKEDVLRSPFEPGFGRREAPRGAF